MAQKKIIAAFVCTALSFVGSARADRVERGVVVSIEAGEAYFDIAAARGLAPGRPVRIKRPVSLPHPTTGQMVRDELLVGSGVVTLVGERLSMVKLDDDVAAVVAVGDVIEALVASSEPLQAKTTAVAANKLPAIPRVAPATRGALKTWNANIGSPLDVKLAAWRGYLVEFPASPHIESVRAHIAALEALALQTPNRLISGERTIRGLEHNARSRVFAGDAIAIAIATRNPAELVGAWLHYRRVGEETFTRRDLNRDGDGYFRGTIDGEDVDTPGVEYFVEVATRDGDAALAIGSPSRPIRVGADGETDAAAFRERSNRSRVSVSVDYIDYGTFDRRADGELHRDRFIAFNTDFLFRLRSERTRLWGIRVGLGAITGEGGFADEPISESAGFNYGFTEFEFRILSESAVSARGVAGIGRDGLGYGIEARLRLGAEEDSNLTFGVSSLEEIGFLSEVRMQWAALDAVPLGFSVGVSDRPNRGDLGVRLGADIGWRPVPWAQPTLRISYQGRSLAHSGVGVGAGLVFDW